MTRHTAKPRAIARTTIPAGWFRPYGAKGSNRNTFPGLRFASSWAILQPSLREEMPCLAIWTGDRTGSGLSANGFRGLHWRLHSCDGLAGDFLIRSLCTQASAAPLRHFPLVFCARERYFEIWGCLLPTPFFRLFRPARFGGVLSPVGSSSPQGALPMQPS